MWNVKKTIFIDRRTAEVHRFATNPVHWHEWYEGLSEVENLLGTGGKGTSMNLNYYFFGRSLELHILVVENVRLESGYIWRALITGAFDADQTWRYIPTDGGTEIQFEMNYELPGSILGKAANKLYIKKLMSNSVDQTLQNLKDISESD